MMQYTVSTLLFIFWAAKAAALSCVSPSTQLMKNILDAKYTDFVTPFVVRGLTMTAEPRCNEASCLVPFFVTGLSLQASHGVVTYETKDVNLIYQNWPEGGFVEKAHDFGEERLRTMYVDRLVFLSGGDTLVSGTCTITSYPEIFVYLLQRCRLDPGCSDEWFDGKIWPLYKYVEPAEN